MLLAIALFKTARFAQRLPKLSAILALCLLFFTSLSVVNAAPGGKGGGKGGSKGEAAPITVAVEVSKSSFSLSERVYLTVVIKNISTDVVTVCNYTLGVLHVESFKKDGRKVRGKEGIAFESYEEPFEWVENLVGLEPMETMSISYPLLPAFGQAGIGPIAIDMTLRPPKRRDQRLQESFVSYGGLGAGSYEVTLAYEYTGPTDGESNVVTERVVGNPVTFVVE